MSCRTQANHFQFHISNFEFLPQAGKTRAARTPESRMRYENILFYGTCRTFRNPNSKIRNRLYPLLPFRPGSQSKFCVELSYILNDADDMSTREQLLDLLGRKSQALRGRYPISRLALFGSWARGEATDQSDVDLLVEVDPTIGLRFVDLADELEAALGRRVDLVSRRALKPAMWEKIKPDLIDA